MAQNPFTSATAGGGTISPMDIFAPDAAAQQRQLYRQQQMIDALRAEAIAPVDTGTQMVSGWALKNNQFAPLQKIGQALLANYQQKQQDTRVTANAQAFAKALRGDGTPSAQGGASYSKRPMDYMRDELLYGKDYAKAMLGSSLPTPGQRDATYAAGGDETAGADLMRDALVKRGLVSLAPGHAVLPAISADGTVPTIPPPLPAQRDANGNFVPSQGVPVALPGGGYAMPQGITPAQAARLDMTGAGLGLRGRALALQIANSTPEHVAAMAQGTAQGTAAALRGAAEGDGGAPPAVVDLSRTPGAYSAPPARQPMPASAVPTTVIPSAAAPIGQPPAAAGVDKDLAYLSDAMQPQGGPGDGRNWDYLKTLPEGMQKQILALSNNTQKAPAAKPAFGQGLLSQARKFDTGYDPSAYEPRQALMKDMLSGASGRNIKAGNTLIGHAAQAIEIFNRLQNKDQPMLNTVNQSMSRAGTGFQLGGKDLTPDQMRQRQDDLSQLEMLLGGVSSEAATAFKGTGTPDVAERTGFEERLPASASPAAMRGAMKALGDMLNSRLNALSDQARSGMGRGGLAPLQFLSPHAKVSLEKIRAFTDPQPATPGAGGLSPEAQALLATYGRKP